MARARFWTCRKCRQRWPRTKQLCTCGGRRPPPRRPKHMAALEQPYEWWVARYGERCGICGVAPKAGKRLHRDHDHRSGKPRGLCCFRCNSGLRSYMTVEWLRSALAYLERER